MAVNQDGQVAPFNPSEHMMQLKSREGNKDYLPVQFRLVWFREQCPNGTIDTEEVEVDLDREMEEEAFAWNAEKKRSEKVIKRAKGYARFKATVTDGKGGRATGTKSECAASFSDYIEKAETGAVGRALAMLGYGTAFAPELNEEHRIVDSGVERSSTPERVPSQEDIKAKLNSLFTRAKQVIACTSGAEFLKWISAELKKPVMSADNLTMDNLTDVEARLDRLAQQSEAQAS